MNDETHDSGAEDQAADGVLRPFEAPEQTPLPPIEPSKVVPDPPAVAEEPVLAEEPAVAEEAAVSEEAVPPPPPIEALADDLWAPESEGSAAPEADPTLDTDEPTTPTEPAAAPEAVGSSVSVEPSLEQQPAAETITLPRKPLLIGLGVLLAAIALLAALWQSAEGDEPEAAIDAPSREVDPVEDTAEDDDPADAPEPVPVDDGSAALLAEAQAEIVSLETEVASLEERPPPALDGTKLRRVVVGADAKFVSALPESVAVVGAFGGVSLIDPDTNQVVANGNVANAATRVLRTSSSVWLTNYSDNQLLRVDPATNTVVAAFAFEGPDGIDKDGDTIIVASFDGEFVARVNPGDGSIMQQVDVGGKPTAVISHPDHGLWAAVFDTGELVEIDRETFEILQRVVVGQGPVGISAAASHLWVANHDEGTIATVEPVAGEVVRTVAVGNGPTELVVVNGSAWVTVTDDGTLVQVDATDGRLLSITPLGGASAGGGPTGISFADATLWIAMQGEQSVVRIDLG